MNQLKKVTTDIGLPCFAGKDYGSDLNTQSTAALLLVALVGGFK